LARMESNKTALLAGATGLVGNELLQYILQRPAYTKVKVLVRRPLQIEHPKLEQIVVDFDHLEQYQEHFRVDDVYCCLGTTIKKAGSQETFKKVDYEYPLALAKLAKQGGAQKFLIITALGSDANSNIFYNRVKGEVEEAIKQIGLPSLHIFQPSLLLGDRQEFRFGEKIGVVLSPLISPLMVGSMKKYRPIQAKDVAFAMYLTAQKSLTGTFVYKSDQIQKRSKTGH